MLLWTLECWERPFPLSLYVFLEDCDFLRPLASAMALRLCFPSLFSSSGSLFFTSCTNEGTSNICFKCLIRLTHNHVFTTTQKKLTSSLPTSSSSPLLSPFSVLSNSAPSELFCSYIMPSIQCKHEEDAYKSRKHLHSAYVSVI